MRRPLAYVPLLLAGLMIAEIAVFVLLGMWLGFGWAILIILAVSLVGGLLLRREGLRAWRGLRGAAEQGRSPGERVTYGVVGLAGALLITVPGLVTGLIGVPLMLPPTRRLAAGRVQGWIERRVSSAAAGDFFGPRRVQVRHSDEPGPPIEGEIV